MVHLVIMITTRSPPPLFDPHAPRLLSLRCMLPLVHNQPGVVDDPPMAIDDDCALGYAQALTYMVCTDRRVHEYRQSVECCAYPGTGREVEGVDG